MVDEQLFSSAIGGTLNVRHKRSCSKVNNKLYLCVVQTVKRNWSNWNNSSWGQKQAS